MIIWSFLSIARSPAAWLGDMHSPLGDVVSFLYSAKSKISDSNADPGWQSSRLDRGLGERIPRHVAVALPTPRDLQF